MAHDNELKPTADEVPVERMVRPHCGRCVCMWYLLAVNCFQRLQ
jgi:hypothetical protein